MNGDYFALILTGSGYTVSPSNICLNLYVSRDNITTYSIVWDSVRLPKDKQSIIRVITQSYNVRWTSVMVLSNRNVVLWDPMSSSQNPLHVSLHAMSKSLIRKYLTSRGLSVTIDTLKIPNNIYVENYSIVYSIVYILNKDLIDKVDAVAYAKQLISSLTLPENDDVDFNNNDNIIGLGGNYNGTISENVNTMAQRQIQQHSKYEYNSL